MDSSKTIFTSNDNGYFIIDSDIRKYCIHLKDDANKGNQINKVWVSQINKKQGCNFPNIANTTCTGLGSIMKLIYNFLYHIHFEGHLLLTDASVIDGKETPIPRLLAGQKSIYFKFGFDYQFENLEEKEKYAVLVQNIQNKVVSDEYIVQKFNTNPIIMAKIEEIKKQKDITVKDISKLLIDKNINTDISDNYNDFYKDFGKYHSDRYLNIGKELLDIIQFFYWIPLVNTNYVIYENCDQIGGFNKYSMKQ